MSVAGQARSLAPLLAIALGACATDSIVPATPRVEMARAIAPYEFHEECARLAEGDRLDYRFEAKAPVDFEIYYREGIAYISIISRDDIRAFSGVFQAARAHRYCLRWEAGREGALLEFHIRLLPVEPLS